MSISRLIPTATATAAIASSTALGEGRLPVTMRQTHLGGDRVFVDYAGDTVPVVVDRLTGEIRDAHLFVAVLGASSLSFAWASWIETLPDWTDAHVRAFDSSAA
jgi:transposase